MDGKEIDIKLVKNEQTKLNIKPKHHVNVPFEKATFGMGCYWSAEALFGVVPGVLRTRVGYSGGKEKFSNENIADHTEAVEIDFDPEMVSYEFLLNLFWNNHESSYTVKTKRKYMSMILFHSEDQKAKAETSKHKEQTERSSETILTEILTASVFYPSEDRQQKYRLQQHKELVDSLELNSKLLQRSHVAAKLNGFLVGAGKVEQFNSEIQSLGLTPSQIDYVTYFHKKFENVGLFC